jgi:hypothetical protein
MTPPHHNPVDLLALMDRGEDSARADPHVASCPRCSAALDRLVASARRSPPPSVTSLARRARPFAVERAQPPRKGDLWITATAYAGPHGGYDHAEPDLVLVVDDGVEEFGERWYPVIAVDTEIEAVTDTDPWLDPRETTLGGPLRLRLALQADVLADQLDHRVGTLTEGGLEALTAAFERALAPERYGPPLEGPDDWRIADDEDVELGMLRLALVHSVYEDASDASTDFAAEFRERWSAADSTAREALIESFASLPVVVAEGQLELGTGWWPVTAASHMINVHLDSLGLLVVSLLPAALEGAWPLIALPGAEGPGPATAWWDDTPGLLAPQGPVRNGVLELRLAGVAGPLTSRLVAGLALLPIDARDRADTDKPLAATGPVAPSSSWRVPLAEGVEAVVDLTAGAATPSVEVADAAQEGPWSVSAITDAVRRLAVAEARRAGDPGGLWALDGALAAIEIAAAVGLADRAPEPGGLLSMLLDRAPEAAARLTALPREVPESLGHDLRTFLPDLVPLRDWIDGSALDAFDTWRSELVVTLGERLTIEQKVPETPPTVHADSRREVAPPLDVLRSGLVAPDGVLTATADPTDATFWVARLPIRAVVAQAYARVVAAAEAVDAAGAAPAALREQECARLVLEALVRAPVARDAERVPVSLPPVWVQLFDPATGRVTHSAELELMRGALAARLPAEVISTGILISMQRASWINPRAWIADALTSHGDERPASANAIRALSRALVDPQARDTLDRVA